MRAYCNQGCASNEQSRTFPDGWDGIKVFPEHGSVLGCDFNHPDLNSFSHTCTFFFKTRICIYIGLTFYFTEYSH